jgi:hypothetical protein
LRGDERVKGVLASDLGRLSVNELGRMCTPLWAAVTVTPGPVDPTKLALLEGKGFDQAPVEDAKNHAVLGLVETRYLRDQAERGEVLSADDPVLQDGESWFRVGSSVGIDALLETMTRRRAVIVVEDNDTTQYGPAESGLGLLTISDLNRHTLRGALYSLMAHVEAELAGLVEGAFPDAWAWIRSLHESHQVAVLGYWELSKRRGVDVGPVAAATLTQLIQVTARHKHLLARLGFESRTRFENETGGIADLRNRVMHPVRPLILDGEDVAAVRKAVSAVWTLAMRMAQNGDGPTTGWSGPAIGRSA